MECFAHRVDVKRRRRVNYPKVIVRFFPPGMAIAVIRNHESEEKSRKNGKGTVLAPRRLSQRLNSTDMNRALLCAAFFVVCLLSGFHARSQLISYQFDIDHKSLTTNVPLNEISARAFRNFVKTFGYVSGSIWRKQRQGYSATFYSADSALYVSHYSNRGRPAGIYVYYTGGNAPADVRSLMRYLYTGDQILYVDEFRSGAQSLFEIGLEEGGQLRVVQQKDGDVKTVRLFTMQTCK